MFGSASVRSGFTAVSTGCWALTKIAKRLQKAHKSVRYILVSFKLIYKDNKNPNFTKINIFFVLFVYQKKLLFFTDLTDIFLQSAMPNYVSTRPYCLPCRDATLTW